MRQIFFAWTYSFFLLFGQGNPVQSFYNLIHQDHIVTMEIEFFQKQFENIYKSSGSFYLLRKKHYVFDSTSFQMIVKDSLVTTINHETKQVIYSSIVGNQVSILDILSGHNKYIKFSDELIHNYINNFSIPDLGYIGSFEFDQNTGLLKMIKLNIDDNQNVSIKIKSIKKIKDYNVPNFNLKKFEIIDLRG